MPQNHRKSKKNTTVTPQWYLDELGAYDLHTLRSTTKPRRGLARPASPCPRVPPEPVALTFLPVRLLDHQWLGRRAGMPETNTSAKMTHFTTSIQIWKNIRWKKSREERELRICSGYEAFWPASCLSTSCSLTSFTASQRLDAQDSCGMRRGAYTRSSSLKQYQLRFCFAWQMTAFQVHTSSSCADLGSLVPSQVT